MAHRHLRRGEILAVVVLSGAKDLHLLFVVLSGAKDLHLLFVVLSGAKDLHFLANSQIVQVLRCAQYGSP